MRRHCPPRALRCALAALLAAFAVPLGCAPAVAATATEAAASTHPYAPHVAEASQRFGIPARWIWRVMRAESRGNSRAVSHAGARGLMQIMPGTWAMLTARHRLGSDPFDTRANILAGAAYLRQMWDRYRDIALMLAAYNAGPGRADAYAAGRRDLPAETAAYVAAIAPDLGASGVAPLTLAPSPDAPSWRQAPLFTTPPASVRPGIGAPPAHVSEVFVPPRSNLLFVPLSGRGE